MNLRDVSQRSAVSDQQSAISNQPPAISNQLPVPIVTATATPRNWSVAPEGAPSPGVQKSWNRGFSRFSGHQSLKPHRPEPRVRTHLASLAHRKGAGALRPPTGAHPSARVIQFSRQVMLSALRRGPRCRKTPAKHLAHRNMTPSASLRAGSSPDARGVDLLLVRPLRVTGSES